MENNYVDEGTVGLPSIIALMFGKRETDIRYQMFLSDAERLGIRIRPVELVDISVPIDENFNDAVEFLKNNCDFILKQYWDALPLKKIINWKLKSAGLVPFNYKDFVPGYNRRYGSRGLLPLFVDAKHVNMNFPEIKLKRIKALQNLSTVENV